VRYGLAGWNDDAVGHDARDGRGYESLLPFADCNVPFEATVGGACLDDMERAWGGVFDAAAFDYNHYWGQAPLGLPDRQFQASASSTAPLPVSSNGRGDAKILNKLATTCV